MLVLKVLSAVIILMLPLCTYVADPFLNEWDWGNLLVLLKLKRVFIEIECLV
jgi:hypothetical protein